MCNFDQVFALPEDVSLGFALRHIESAGAIILTTTTVIKHEDPCEGRAVLAVEGS
jgi:hypothetical protein